jgi:hypothetical protein
MGSKGQVRVPGRGLCVRTRPGVPGADTYWLGRMLKKFDDLRASR